MILRIDRLAPELPWPKEPDRNGAAAVQELPGVRFGETCALMNYTCPSFGFRARRKLKPYYDLIANIGAAEYGPIGLVSATINMMLTGTARTAPPQAAPLQPGRGLANTRH